MNRNTAHFLMNTLRWVLVLPVAFISLLGMGFIWRITYFYGTGTTPEGYGLFDKIIVEIMSNVVAGASFVYAGVYVAPLYKKVTTVILVMLLSAISGISLFLINFFSEEYLSNLGVISILFGAGYMCFDQFQKESLTNSISASSNNHINENK